MRLDKYLQVSRLVKKRGHTRDLVEEGRIEVNGHTAKASRVVREGDLISIRLWRKQITIRVLECPSGNVSRKEAGTLYEIIEECQVEEDSLFFPD